MNSTARLLNPSEAAKQLGISAKALRVYEERGLLTPSRTMAGWRAYGPEDMTRAREIVELRALGLTLGDIARALGGDAAVLANALALHEAALQSRARQLHEIIGKVRRFRAELDTGVSSSPGDYRSVLHLTSPIEVAFDLPWPWGGERFELRTIKPLNYIVGPLGSGKTRLAMRLAEEIPGGNFVGLDRAADGASGARTMLENDHQLNARVERALASIIDDGGTESDALLALVTALEVDTSAVQVIDMIEHGLNASTQEALAASLRRRSPSAQPLFCLTRSNAILDLDAICEHEAIILCPANHSPPILVPPYRGACGYEAVATCLASPDVRARTEGVIAWRETA